MSVKSVKSVNVSKMTRRRENVRKMSVKMAFLVKCQENVSKKEGYCTLVIFVLQAHSDTRFLKIFACGELLLAHVILGKMSIFRPP